MNEQTELNLPAHYPDWVKAYFNAPTEELPGILGRWSGIYVRVTEDDRSITFYALPTLDAEPDVTFYGSREKRRAALVCWLGVNSLVPLATARIISGTAVEFWKNQSEFPLRLMLSEKHGNEVFGGPWK